MVSAMSQKPLFPMKTWRSIFAFKMAGDGENESAKVNARIAADISQFLFTRRKGGIRRLENKMLKIETSTQKSEKANF